MRVDAPVQQILEGLEKQMMKQIKMNYGAHSNLMSIRAADAQKSTQKSIHLPPLWPYPRRWGVGLFQLLTFTPKVTLGSLIQLSPQCKSLDCVRKAHKATGRTYEHREKPLGPHRCAATNIKITGTIASQSRLQLQFVVEL